MHSTSLTSSSRKLERKRETPLLPASAISKELPSDVPIDYFDPPFYNSLSVPERTRYIHTGVAFPLAKYVKAPEHAGWKKMNAEKFMEKYGKEVLAQYNIPSEEEIAEYEMNEEMDIPEVIDLRDTDDEDTDEATEVEEELH